MNIRPHAISRREFAQTLAPIGFGSLLLSRSVAASETGPTVYRMPLNTGWTFAGTPGLTLPHCIAKLSWKDWDPATWQHAFTYQRRFSLPPAMEGKRILIEFEGVMTSAKVAINGHALAEHRGGYLPFRREITQWIKPGENLLEVEADSRWQDIPPDGSPKGPVSVDYLEPGGIIRPASLYAVPQAFISDVFAKPVKVLDPDRRVDVTLTFDAASVDGPPLELFVVLREGLREIAGGREFFSLRKTGLTEITVPLTKLKKIELWSPDSPQLYEVAAVLWQNGQIVHNYRVRIGFRETRFEVDGFFLNGRRTHLFGLNRHEIYPYVGFAMPRRVMRRDAEILRREFHCNVVRCSHYPQSEAFLDACDELGLMVWEETPGWGYLGDDVFKEQVVENVRDMVVRDRNHPSIVIWGVRVNESKNDLPLYARTTEIAKKLDGTRPCSGSMTPGSMRTWKDEWHEDVFAFDDYHAEPDGTVGIREPLPGVPYMLAEAVGQFNYAARKGFDAKYVRTGDTVLQAAQAVRHAQAHDRARAFPRNCGVIAWCAFDYASLVNSYQNVKTPGVADVFRVPKLGAAFYQAQVSPKLQPVIAPAFYWDFGPQTPSGPGKNAAIFSNCDRLEIFVGGKRVATLEPDRTAYPHLDYPPYFCDLTVDGAEHPDLRIDGYVADRLALSRSFSSDPSHDQFLLHADDDELSGDGSDATRLAFQVTDRFGAPRPFAGDEVRFEIAGPGTIIGDNPFQLSPSGGAGAVWIRTVPGGTGRIDLTAAHSSLGKKTAGFRVVAPRAAE